MKIFQSKKEIPHKIDFFSKHFFNNPLFYDIETTGFSRDFHMIYMIGIGKLVNETIVSTHFLAETKEDEVSIIKSFFDALSDSDLLISYNGKRFDLPFIIARAQKHSLSLPLIFPEELDIYLEAKPLFRLLPTPDQKLKTMEHYLHITRNDKMTGGELITVFQSYLNTHDAESETLLLKHNTEDILNLPELMQLLSIKEILSFEHLSNFNYSIEEFTGANGNPCKELALSYNHSCTITNSFIFYCDQFFIRIDPSKIRIQIPIKTGNMLYFYDNYKDYYYLPEEDRAIHKSVASFLPKELRQKAKASNCYQKYEGDFLPNPNNIFSPSFKQSYKSKDSFLALDQSKDYLLSHIKKYLQTLLTL
ncbi:ribonuclease H-like domain-containing protein [Eubacterium oxidoreducens]|uniref:YprB ribonuclease H-like domain-containing protein n=1 Tax=Eubacterium oxidoreducens TaxID=1732 RepID=A0A1G6AN15_EUBOX|nr:ribonuclease H-like domain-containing protein [Eubacterium oxidoreducens]SDB09806.1 hypothetical protein SAMN02910417_00753 [Eubacterium oxidoreducens]